jgi:hypothetical protein
MALFGRIIVGWRPKTARASADRADMGFGGIVPSGC